ncbi:hypothetical protein K443DRAFT_104520 [Laccaria amethystina LaAM-08-1]|uniref:Uncharacterized protein n=1 Tax=Laccaria amethystina LaAM-08-1 TaxID=1095629 RepID=A0A0C9XQ32_9AGAR|nr:hypothetical protein K443DRAFT_104520 [Laccaria amethystina LaAM-08-1]
MASGLSRRIGSFTRSLLCVGAECHGRLIDALPQLVVYLACLRQSRVNRGRNNTSVYGVATDGLSYVFVTITHEGVLKKSRLLDIMQGKLSTVLGCLQYLHLGDGDGYASKFDSREGSVERKRRVGGR